MNNIEDFLKNNKELINNFAENYIENIEFPSILKESVKYSLVNDGKKLRPLIFLAMLDHYGYDYKNFLDIALSIELVHTYSLVHDDLPAMDNDDYRWGKFTNHKVYGEEVAILTGDAMQTLAYNIISKNDILEDSIKIRLIMLLSDYSGVNGMLAGQIYDIKQDSYYVDENYLENMHNLKTGKLITLPLIFAAIISNNDNDIEFLTSYGYDLGLAYQIKDDILDYYGDFKLTGKKFSDEDMITYLSFYGIEKCEELLDLHTEKAKSYASKLNNSLLNDFASLLLSRQK
ncbi:polyprenyl synthetase family protein [Gemelliphila palaticanis]|uniref:Polyprenyl synthetase family protein n=1 Tax=Gemelliphila palaticanis TaxID=81950 RepID=A0ABX2SZF3_9BACL|nr:farnesyl diphosphate synthase [Gemella palaticanis]MBF0715740.1 polyprenyl synthetase family protein [Gemella palaticanis]NYS47670.1 polyprenyl synthetase family protein [Gemella palaticanis]